MGNQTFLEHLGLILTSATACLWLARWLGMPAIVAYLLAGLAIGPLTGWIGDAESTDLITDTGIVLLLFLVGLELTFEKIRDLGKVALLAGSAQVILTAGGGAAFCMVLGFRGWAVWVLGFALAFSSTVVVVKMLVSRGETHTLFGQIAVGVLLVQDIVVVLLLTVLGAIGGGAGGLIQGVALATGGMLGLLAAVLAAARFLLPRPLAWSSRSPETLFIISLCWCFLVVMATHLLHLSHEIGAFIAGVSLAQLPYNHDLQRRVQPLINFFVAVFFVTLGIGMQFQADISFWIQAVLLSLFVLVGKFTIVMVIVVRLRHGAKAAFYSALMLSQISEFSFILAGVASRAGLLGTSAASLLGVVGLITISVSAVAMTHKERLFHLLEKRVRLFGFGSAPGESEGADPSDAKPPREGHIVIVGMNTLGRELARRLTERGETVVGIDVDPEKMEGLPCHTLLGDSSMLPVLQEAGFERARLLVSTLHIAPVNDLLAYRCRAVGTRCSIHAFDLNGLDNLLEMDVSYLIVPQVDGIKRQNALLSGMGILESK